MGPLELSRLVMLRSAVMGDGYCVKGSVREPGDAERHIQVQRCGEAPNLLAKRAAVGVASPLSQHQA